MTLDEAIKHCKEKAEESRKNEPIFRYAADEKEADKCLKCAEEHEQLAAWLTELKELKARPSREAVEKDELEDYQRGYHKGLKVGKRIGAREERKTIIAYIEGKTIEEDQIEQMIKNGEVEAIPYLGETTEEEPNV